MKLDVTKDGYTRAIKPTKLQEYLDAGWQQSGSEQAEGVTILKPPARVKAAVKDAEDNNTIETYKGE